MIPTEIVRFLEGASVGLAATRDAELVPELHRIESWYVSDDRKMITCLLPPNYSNKLLPSLEDNGQFAFVTLGSTSGPRASHPPNPSVDFHECYQFKGRFVDSRPVDERDQSLVKETAARFKTLFQPLFGFSDRACAARFDPPALAVTFEVHDIYDQTPGPGAGKKLAMDDG